MRKAQDLLSHTKQKYSELKVFQGTCFSSIKSINADKITTIELQFRYSFCRTHQNSPQVEVENYSNSYLIGDKLHHYSDGKSTSGLFDDELIDADIKKSSVDLLQSFFNPSKDGVRNVLDVSEASILENDTHLDGESCTKLLVKPKITPIDELIWIGNESLLVCGMESEHSLNTDKLWSFLEKSKRPVTKTGTMHIIRRYVFQNKLTR